MALLIQIVDAIKAAKTPPKEVRLKEKKSNPKNRVEVPRLLCIYPHLQPVILLVPFTSYKNYLLSGKKAGSLTGYRQPSFYCTTICFFVSSFPGITGRLTCKTPSAYLAVMFPVSTVSSRLKLLSNPPRLYSLKTH